ncbi:MAG: hypothetical protein FJ291_00040 [Planctomycetes bacterium]|nr:hypothetical protein [Planctomycetota bacterium]
MGQENSPSKRERPRELPGPMLSSGQKLECSLPGDLAVVLSQRAFTKLFAYAYATDLEVSCLGVVEREGNRFRVSDLFLVAQECGHAHTKLDQGAIGQLVEQLIAQGRKDEAGSIRCWCHTHPGNMGCFWSHTDEATCQLLVADWLVSIVVSGGFRLRCRLDLAGPVPVRIDHVAVCLEGAADQPLSDECKREVAEKVCLAPPGGPLGFEPLAPPAQPATDKDDLAIEEVVYCERCGAWHGPRPEDCALSRLPGFSEALKEGLAKDGKPDFFDDDFPFGDLFPE